MRHSVIMVINRISARKSAAVWNPHLPFWLLNFLMSELNKTESQADGAKHDFLGCRH